MIIHVNYFNFFSIKKYKTGLYNNHEQFNKQFIFLSLDCGCQKLFSLIHQTWFSILSVALNCKAVNHALFKKNKIRILSLGFKRIALPVFSYQPNLLNRGQTSLFKPHNPTKPGRRQIMHWIGFKPRFAHKCPSSVTYS